MPVFGEYETVGEPLAVTPAWDQTATIWRVRKIGSGDGREYILKSVAKHPKAGQDQSEEKLGSDSGLEFIEAVKQLKKAQSGGGRWLSPIHDFGTFDTGVWYVTDYCKRGSLKNWVILRGGVDDAALRRVVFSVVAGCQMLKRSCGRSHGNLKLSNVLLGGKTQPLRKTPFLLIDPLPVSSTQVSSLETGDRRLVVDIFEVQDLRAIGELILQLVEGRLFESRFDYNYPIASSPAWKKLGKDEQRWRELCNRLIDPQLSLEKINLEKLEKQFRTNPVMAILPAVLATAGLMGLCAGALFFIKPIIIRQPQQNTTGEVGSSASFKIVAWGFKLKYQWWKNEDLVPGATNSILRIPSVQTNDDGRYYVVVVNRAGAITSAVAWLKVRPFVPKLMIATHNTNRAYGEDNPPLTGVISGLLPNDDITVTYRSPARISSPVGNYDITPVFNDPDNKLRDYAVITNRGTLTVTPAKLTVTVDNKLRIRDENNPPLTGTISGLRLGDNITATYRTMAGISSPSGEYDIVPVIYDPDNKLRNYIVITNEGTLTITLPPQTNVTRLTITTENKSRVYGENNPPLTGAISGLRLNDDITATYRTPASINSPVGNYDIVPVLNDPDNKLRDYDVITNKGTLTITPADLVVTANGTNRAYGEDNPPLSGKISNLRSGDRITATYHTPAGINSPVGNYNIMPVLNDPDNKLHNYIVITNKGTLAVTQINLIVTADTKRRVLGETNPPLTGTISGLRLGDDITATYRTLANIDSPVGDYDIVPVFYDPDNKLRNYTVITNKGSLTVEPPSRSPLTNVFGISGFDFVWIAELRDGKGAYVEKTEMSQIQYKSLAGRFGLSSSKLPISGSTPVCPINLAYDDAVHLRDGLNNAARQSRLQGQFQLPDEQDFLMFSEIRDSTTTSNPTYEELARILPVPTGSPRGVEAGNANKYGLFNVLGNAWQWCDDQSGAGFEFDSTFGSLFRNHRDVQGLYTSVRFLVVPNQ